MPGSVVFEASMRGALSRTSLIEQDDPVSLRVEETTILWNQSPAGPSMQKHDWLTIGIPTFFVIELMDRRNSQPASRIRLDGVIKFRHKVGIIARSRCSHQTRASATRKNFAAWRRVKASNQ